VLAVSVYPNKVFIIIAYKEVKSRPDGSSDSHVEWMMKDLDVLLSAKDFFGFIRGSIVDDEDVSFWKIFSHFADYIFNSFLFVECCDQDENFHDYYLLELANHVKCTVSESQNLRLQSHGN